MGSSSGTGGLGLALSGGLNSGGLGPIPGTGSCTTHWALNISLRRSTQAVQS